MGMPFSTLKQEHATNLPIRPVAETVPPRNDDPNEPTAGTVSPANEAVAETARPPNNSVAAKRHRRVTGFRGPI